MISWMFVFILKKHLRVAIQTSERVLQTNEICFVCDCMNQVVA